MELSTNENAALDISRLVGLTRVVGIIVQVVFLRDLHFVLRVALISLVRENLLAVNVKFIRAEMCGRFLVREEQSELLHFWSGVVEMPGSVVDQPHHRVPS